MMGKTILFPFFTPFEICSLQKVIITRNHGSRQNKDYLLKNTVPDKLNQVKILKKNALKTWYKLNEL